MIIMINEVQLQVHEQEVADVYHDRARIPQAFRCGIKEGHICRIWVVNHSALLEIRSLHGESRGIIRLDDKTRGDLDLESGKSYTFRLRPASLWAQFSWAWNASDSAARIAARLGLLGLVLGLVGVILGILPLLEQHC